MTTTLASDFRSLNIVSYEDYIYEKGSPFLILTGEFPYIRKNSGNLTIGEEVLDISNKTINDVIDILLDKIPGLDITYIEENDVNYFNTSALFLADFNTKNTVLFKSADRKVYKKALEEYTDRFNNEYSLDFIYFCDNIGQPLPFRKEEGYLIFEPDAGIINAYCFYNAKKANVLYLQEYPVMSYNDNFMAV